MAENGGLTAPNPPERGLGSAHRPRAVNRKPRRSSRHGRRLALGQEVAQTQALTGPDRGPVRQGREFGQTAVGGRGPGVGDAQQVSRGQAPGVGDAQQAGLGNQLSRRVSAGEITQQQAQQTAHDRAILEKAYGKNWRVKVFGDRGYTQRTRQNLAAGKDAGQNKELYSKLMEDRKRALERAKAKLG